MTSYIAPATKILRYPAVLAAMQRGERVWPLHVEIDLAGVCNARCEHCRFGGGRQGEGVMDGRAARDIIDQLVGGGTRAVTFSGGGEPTCNPEYADIVCYARHEGLEVGVYSNGLASDRLLQAANVCRWVYVSLDADNAADYRRIKGVDGFEEVCNLIKTLAARGLMMPNGPVEVTERRRGLYEHIINDRRHACVVGVGFLLNGQNWHRARAMHDLGKGLGADYVQFRPVAGLDDYGYWVPFALEELGQQGLMHAPDRFHDLMADWMGVYERGYSVCRASELGPCIGSDGTVWVCPNTRGLRKLGNVNEEAFADIWERREVQQVGPDCEPTCRHHGLNKTLALVCEAQAHEEFV